MIQCAVYTLLFFIQNLCFFWEAISHKTHNYQWRWDCQIFVNEEKKLVKPWDQTIASRLTVRYNHLGSWLILNVYRHEHTHQVSTLHISRSSDLTVQSLLLWWNTQFFLTGVGCCESFPLHCVYTQGMGHILSYSPRHGSTCCLWKQLWLTDCDPHALVSWTLWHRNSSIAVVWADHDLRLFLLISGQN